MRFKRGSMVEVLSKKEPSGAWRCAEIVADNGDGYTVRYYRRPGIAKDGVDNVQAEAVRSCPRPATGSRNFVVGDIVEVLDDGYWRVARIDEVMEDDYCYIRVIGSLDEFRVKNSSIRARQEWKNNKWVLMDKKFENRKDLVTRMCKKSHVEPQSNLHEVQEVPESVVMSKSLKRSSPDYASADNAYSKCVQKRRLDKEVELDAIHGEAYSFTGKVDNPANQWGNLGRDNVQIITEKTIRFNKANSRNHELDDCVSTESSVASCSITNAISDRLLSDSSAGCSQDSASLSSDAESHSYLGEEEEVSQGQLERDDALQTHELDLYGYRCVLESLYASGPLSWQQETALTNLRLKLYVSNDEHLTELRRLRSIGNLGLSCQ
ncbi:uncharacterized protein LOC104887681 isoform X1 [Beta vulgaris subsp. vulgaris]|uniref:uncharacterized protein LOC104887681 isoform X1 n=1 Tax=Beta vulgaris subsp. vulgaris TaxID=3555 RepID=UPI0020369F7B|nr:uncharacterized protein LOC104887681 isoform X1 [Beta vulgaris subsp. vulgaris]